MKNEFTEFMEWVATQPERTMVSAVLLRLWNNFQAQKQPKKYSDGIFRVTQKEYELEPMKYDSPLDTAK